MAGRAGRLFGLAKWLTLPLGLVSGCAWLSLANPATCMFDESFWVRNDTSTPIWFTPIGHFPSLTERRVIPQRLVRGVGLPSLGDSHRVGPGQSIAITYDSDDIVVSELVIRSASLPSPRVFPVKRPIVNGATLIVEDFDSLPLAKPVHLEGASNYSCWRSWLLLLVFVVPLGFSSVARRLNRQSLRSSASAA